MSDVEIYIPHPDPYVSEGVDEKSLVLAGGNKSITAGEWRRRVVARRAVAFMTVVNAGVALWGFSVIGPLLGMIFTFLFVVALLATFVVPFEGITAGE